MAITIKDTVYLGAAKPSSGGGSSNYNDLSNKPKINGVTLSGNKTSADLGIKGSVQIAIESTTPVQGYVVPSPTAEEMTAVYNAIVAGSSVQIVDSNDVYYQVLQADLVDDAINVEALYFSELALLYTLENETVTVTGKKLGGTVESVNGKTGVVVLDAEDVGATVKNVISLTGESGTLTAAQIAQVQDDTAVLEIVCDGEVFRLSNKDSTLTYRTFMNTNCEASETVSFKVIYVQLNSEAVNYGVWTLEEVSAGSSEPTVETVTGNTPTIANVQGNHIYNCTGTLTSLTLTAVETTYAEATIYMTTGASITVNVPASVKTIGYTEFSPNTSYIISFANNTMVIGEINA